MNGCRFISTNNNNYTITETKHKFMRCRVQYCKNRGRRRKNQKKNMQRAKQSSNFWSILSYYDRTCFRSSKDKWRNNMNFVLRLKIYFSLRTMFWTMYFLFVGVLFTDCLIVYIILITLFMIWEQCLILNTGKTVLRRKFHFARGVRGFVNSAWRWGFVFNVFRKWSKVSEIVF